LSREAVTHNRKTLLSVVIPAYNEQESLHEAHRRLTDVLAAMELDYELVFVNDGSRDSTLEILLGLKQADRHVAVVDLSRNFGKEIALSAGLDVAEGDAVIVIDADLQDPPELIPELVSGWRLGYDVVYAQRTVRKGETWFKRATAHSFYRVMTKLTRVAVPRDTGDYRLLSRRAVAAIRRLREHHRFMKGLFAWIGYPQLAVPYERDPRFAGATSWNYWRLWNLALEGITSFTTVPLRVSSYVGLTTAAAALSYGLFVFVRTLFFGNPVAGYPSLIVIVLFLGGIQLMAIGVLGEYLGRIFNETKGRPLYFVNNFLPAEVVHREADEVRDTRAHETQPRFANDRRRATP
jgi:polyisoprenyl-phosphate glycosyltransferase